MRNPTDTAVLLELLKQQERLFALLESLDEKVDRLINARRAGLASLRSSFAPHDEHVD
jgi:hypothetical protein